MYLALFLSQDLKKSVTDWTKRKSQLENTAVKKRENHQPADEVKKAQQKLDEHVATEPSQKWMLDARESFRDIIKDPKNFRAGEQDTAQYSLRENNWTRFWLLDPFFLSYFH